MVFGQCRLSLFERSFKVRTDAPNRTESQEDHELVHECTQANLEAGHEEVRGQKLQKHALQDQVEIK